MDAVVSYRNKKPPESSDSDSSDENDDDCDVWKRAAKNPVFEPQQEQQNPNGDGFALQQAPSASSVIGVPTKRKINNVWSNVLQEQTVSDDLSQVGLTKKPRSSQDRSCESYDFTRKLLDTREPIDSTETMDTACGIDDNEISNAQKAASNKYKRSDHHERFVNMSKEDILLANKIIQRLRERKQHLIYRIVHFIGSDKAMALLKMTEDVEEGGGMMIKNNKRRRTPGGVYIQLLKSDKDVTKAQLDEIFAFEPDMEEMIKSRLEKRKQAKKNYHKARKAALAIKKKNGVCDNVADDSANAVDELDVVQPMSSDVVCTAEDILVEEPNSEIEDGEIVD